MLSLISSL